MSAPSTEIPLVKDIDPEGDVIIVVLPEAPAKKATTDSNAQSAESPKSTPTQTTSVEITPVARFRVCSKHLSLASSYFKSRLNARWSDSESRASDGSKELSLSGFSTEAVQILLNAMHGRNRQIPRAVDHELMVGIAHLTDYLQCQEIVEHFGQSWVNPAIILPVQITSQLKGWIMASICFRHAQACKHTTQIAQRHATDSFDPGLLPIPKSIVGKKGIYLSH